MVEVGAAVVLSDKDTDMLDDTATRLRKSGGNVLARRCDVTSEEQVEQLVQAAVSEFGKFLNVLPTRAGVGAFGWNTPSVSTGNRSMNPRCQFIIKKLCRGEHLVDKLAAHA